MRALFLFCLFLPLHHRAQDARAFRHALLSGNLNQMDRWMKHEVHRQRKGRLIKAPGARYVSHAGTLDSLTAFLTRQPGVLEAAWDRCAKKAAIWPGRSTMGMRWRSGDRIIERCWTIHEGIPGSIRILGWRARTGRIASSSDTKAPGLARASCRSSVIGAPGHSASDFIYPLTSTSIGGFLGWGLDPTFARFQ
ncbi:MAG: hypothetical protein H6591_13895 [Flavobacteriales bacterium]|nr:hypothetical protein [Flavobacteriales bacterium]